MLEDEPAWDEFSVEISAEITDARSMLEDELGISGSDETKWFIFRMPEARIADPEPEVKRPATEDDLKEIEALLKEIKGEQLQ